jgi:hypothetical protein
MKYIIKILLFLSPLYTIYAEIYKPPGYGTNIEGNSLGLDTGIKSINEDYYVTITPIFELPFFVFRIGLQIPLEVLVYDKEPLSAPKTPSLRPGTYNDVTDYYKIFRYITYGTHLYFNPDDAFNWSLHYGIMNDGYIGHRTIVNRYISSYDPSVWSPGLMADINNNWGGIEVFANNALRKEVRGYRVFVRPVGIFTSVWNIAYEDSYTKSQLAYSIQENRDPKYNKNYLFQTAIPNTGKGGRLQQHLLRPLKEDLKEEKVEFREVFDPASGEVKIVPVPKEEIPEPNQIQPSPDTTTKTPTKTPNEVLQDRASDSEGTKSPRKHGFWNRWAIGYTVITDYNAPLSLEVDGSNNLVIDPQTKLPRADKVENLTVTGVDMEFRLSPFTWMDLTPYIDINKFKHIENSRGTHIGINFEMQLSRLVKWSIRPEYREITSNYIPEYFDSTYAIERTQYIQNDQNNNLSTTKLAYLKSLPTDGVVKKGYFLNSLLEFVSFLVIELSYENYDGPNNSKVFTGFYVPNIGGIFLNGYYIKKNFDKFKEAFITKSENALLAAEAGLSFFGGFYIKYTIKRTWTYDSQTNDYKPNDEKTIGFGYGSNF